MVCVRVCAVCCILYTVSQCSEMWKEGTPSGGTSGALLCFEP